MNQSSKPKVFLDANLVIAAGKPPGGPQMARVGDLVRAGLITVLTTDLTITEVSKKHAQNDYDVIKEIGRAHFRKIVEEVTGVHLPALTKTEIKEKLSSRYEASTREMFGGLGAKTLRIDDVKPSIIFADYAVGEGFFTGEGKKYQFPDAFVFECLKAEASAEEPVIIVSIDGDYERPVEGAENISLVKSLPELFSALGLQIQAPKIDQFLEDHKADLILAADQELADWGLVADVDDGEIDETTVFDIEVNDTIAFKSSKDGEPILVVGQMTLKATVSFTHPNWDEAIYNSEDKCLIPLEDLSGETDVTLLVDISMLISLDEAGNPSEFAELRFRNDDFQFVELYPDNHYEF